VSSLDPRSEGHRLLLEARASRPALLLARRAGAPERTMRRWLAGSVPRYAWRVVLARVFGIPIESWQVARASAAAKDGEDAGA